MMKFIIKNEITNLFSVYQDLNIEFIDDDDFNIFMMRDGLVLLIEHLRRELKSRFGLNNFGLIL